MVLHPKIGTMQPRILPLRGAQCQDDSEDGPKEVVFGADPVIRGARVGSLRIQAFDANFNSRTSGDNAHPGHVGVQFLASAVEEQNVAAPAIGPEACAARAFLH